MRTFLLALILACCVSAAFARAPTPPQLPTGVTTERVDVTATFRGEQFFVFSVLPDRRPGADVVVTLRGPSEQRVMRRKRQVWGFWVNTDPVRLRDVPSLFALASNRPLSQIVRSPATISALGLDPGALARFADATPPDSNPADYRRALVRIKRDAGLYFELQRGVTITGDALVKAPFDLPGNASIGEYRIDIFVFRNGRLLARSSETINVTRAGLERDVHDFANRRPILYGLGVVALALSLGGLSAFAMRRK
jgi:uncharacterized protein (TIGR02186 family)